MYNSKELKSKPYSECKSAIFNFWIHHLHQYLFSQSQNYNHYCNMLHRTIVIPWKKQSQSTYQKEV